MRTCTCTGKHTGRRALARPRYDITGKPTACTLSHFQRHQLNLVNTEVQTPLTPPLNIVAQRQLPLQMGGLDVKSTGRNRLLYCSAQSDNYAA